MHFVKGHGTGNDFLVVLDAANQLDLQASEVRLICDRRLGLGADGVLRVVRTDSLPESAAWAQPAEWFMDQRNADGSIAQMCGNGALVFARFLVDSRLATPGHLIIATRAGLRHATAPVGRWVTIDMGKTCEIGSQAAIVHVRGRPFPVIPVSLDVPHAVCVLNDANVSDLAHIDLSEAPSIRQEDFPEGVNLEVVVAHEDGIAMRVYERGVGETLSCGSCACAGAAAWMSMRDLEPPAKVPVVMPGGKLEVLISSDTTLLRGSARIVAEGTIRLNELTNRASHLLGGPA